MVYQTSKLLLHSVPPFSLIAFVFSSTICSYNFHWYLTPDPAIPSARSKWTHQHKKAHFGLYFSGLVVSAFYFLMLRKHWMALVFASFVTFLYSAPKLPHTFFKELKNIAIGKTIFLAFVWMFVTTMLPIFVADKPLQLEYLLFASSRFFLIYSICIIFDYRDREDDKNEGIRSMITFLNEKGINRLFIISLMLFTLSTVALYWHKFPWSVIIILLVPGFITGASFNYSKKKFSDYFYYVILDGLMMFSGLLMLIFGI